MTDIPKSTDDALHSAQWISDREQGRVWYVGV
jgi:hypothetical protein